MPAPVDDAGRLDLLSVLVALAERGLTTLLAEGGPRVAGALLAAGLVDEMMLIRAPVIVGEGGVPALPEGDVAGLLADPGFEHLSHRRLGEDTLDHLWRKG